MALEPPNTISNPNSSNNMMTGANQNFLRSFMKSQRSFKNSIVIPRLLFVYNPLIESKDILRFFH